MAQYFNSIFGTARNPLKETRENKYNYAFLGLDPFDSDKGWHAISVASLE